MFLDVQIIERANAVAQTLTDDGEQNFKRIRELVDTADLAWGVWPPGDKIVVKGEAVLKFIMDSGVPEDLPWTATPCERIEQAVVLKAHVEAGGDAEKMQKLLDKWAKEGHKF